MNTTIDSVTAQFMLSAASMGMGSSDNDKLADLYKSLKSERTPSHADAEKFFKMVSDKYKIGDKVILPTVGKRVGVVHSYNTSMAGFYPGWRYPVYIKINGEFFDNGQPHIFEYDLSQFEHFDTCYLTVAKKLYDGFMAGLDPNERSNNYVDKMFAFIETLRPRTNFDKLADALIECDISHLSLQRIQNETKD